MLHKTVNWIVLWSLFIFIGLMIGCTIKTQIDSRETALLTLWTLTEQELGQAILNQEEINKLSNAIGKALEIVDDEHEGTFNQIMEASTLSKEKFKDAYRLASIMDMFFVVELRDEYREQLREILLSLKSVVATL